MLCLQKYTIILFRKRPAENQVTSPKIMIFEIWYHDDHLRSEKISYNYLWLTVIYILRQTRSQLTTPSREPIVLLATLYRTGSVLYYELYAGSGRNHWNVFLAVSKKVGKE